MKKILIIHNQLWSHYKGKLFNEIYHQSLDTSLEVRVIHIAKVEKSRAGLGELDVSFHQYFYKVLFDKPLEEVSLLPKSLKLLWEVFRFRPDVLNLTGYYDPALWLLILYAKFWGVRLIMSNESTAQDHIRKGWKESFKRFLVKQFDGFFCFGTKAAQYMQDLGAKPSQIWVKNAAVVDNDFFAERFKNTNKAALRQQYGVAKRNFIFVGRLITVKNIITLLDSFATLQNADWGLVLVGNGYLLPNLQAYIQQKNIMNVTFVAGKAWEEIPSLLVLGDVFVLPSISETWGLVVNEAMTCGLPIIVSSQCGCAIDLVKEGENGFIFDPHNTKDLSQKLSFFVNNEPAITIMGNISTQIITRFSPKNVAKQMIKYFG